MVNTFQKLLDDIKNSTKAVNVLASDNTIIKAIIMNIYELRPVLENEKLLLRLANDKDCDNLLKVYSDQNANHILIVKNIVVFF